MSSLTFLVLTSPTKNSLLHPSLHVTFNLTPPSSAKHVLLTPYEPVWDVFISYQIIWSFKRWNRSMSLSDRLVRFPVMYVYPSTALTLSAISALTSSARCNSPFITANSRAAFSFLIRSCSVFSLINLGPPNGKRKQFKKIKTNWISGSRAPAHLSSRQSTFLSLVLTPYTPVWDVFVSHPILLFIQMIESLYEPLRASSEVVYHIRLF